MNIKRILPFLVVVCILTSLGAQTIAESYVLDSSCISYSDKWYIATDTIAVMGDYRILADTEVRLISGQSISFQPGFSVASGAEFVAAIGDMDDLVIEGTVDWNGARYIKGDLTISGPAETNLLDIGDNSEVYFLDGGSLIVNGELLATGTCFGSAPQDNGLPSQWGGIVNSGTLTLADCSISDAKQGILQMDGILDIHGSLISNTFIGIHLFGFSDPAEGASPLSTLPAITDCLFQDNRMYAVKEDEEGDSKVNKSTFKDNGHLYYDVDRAVMSIDELNATLNNWDNIER